MGWIRQLVSPYATLAEETECCNQRTADQSRLQEYNESRTYRVRQPENWASASASHSSTVQSHTEECGEPEIDYYAARDPWYTQPQSNRPFLETVWVNRMAAPRIAPVMSAVSASVDPATAEGDPCYAGRRRPVPLDAPDVALRGQRLLAYGERLQREEAEVAIVEPGRTCHPARLRQPMAGRQPPKAVDRQPPTQPMADVGDDVRALGCKLGRRKGSTWNCGEPQK